jgi:pyruvate dehydrogenase (quinone)/pyruvate oxidase
MDVAKYSVRVMGRHTSRTSRTSPVGPPLLYRGVSHITFPVDLQEQTLNTDRSKRNIAGHMTELEAHSARLPNDADLAQAADILKQGKKVVILAGRGAIGASTELEQVAELLGAPIVKPLLGKAAVPDDSPYTTGGIGLLGRVRRRMRSSSVTRC